MYQTCLHFTSVKLAHKLDCVLFNGILITIMPGGSPQVPLWMGFCLIHVSEKLLSFVALYPCTDIPVSRFLIHDVDETLSI